MNKKSIAALENLRGFPPVNDAFETSKRSAVLVPLILNPSTGDLEVILTKREAFEEVGLPHEASEHLTTLYPALSRHYQVVTPVIAYCAHLTTEDIAQLRPNPGEVAAIFTTPLEHFLDPPKGSYDFFDMHWLSSPHRVHRFDGCGADNYILGASELAEPSSIQQDFKQVKTGDTEHHGETETAFPGWSVYGLTAGVILEVAKVAYARPPSFQEYAPDQVLDVELMAKWHNQTFTKSHL
ncbi:hypothetical protein BGZ81_005656 [Podila clonocystis]|nr:hypothetical protein BGZ81_005656 [Podila clonocystis]